MMIILRRRNIKNGYARKKYLDFSNKCLLSCSTLPKPSKSDALMINNILFSSMFFFIIRVNFSIVLKKSSENDLIWVKFGCPIAFTTILDTFFRVWIQMNFHIRLVSILYSESLTMCYECLRLVLFSK